MLTLARGQSENATSYAASDGSELPVLLRAVQFSKYLKKIVVVMVVYGFGILGDMLRIAWRSGNSATEVVL